MAEIVGAFLGAALQVAQWVSKPISRQFNYLCCFTTNIVDLNHEAQKLDGATSRLKGRVDTAYDNVEIVFPEVLTWLENSKIIKGQTKSILDEVPNVKSGCLKLRARFSFSRRAKKTIDRMKVLQDEGKFPVISERGPPAAKEAVSLGTTYEFESRKQIKEEMMTTLRDEDVNMIGICGMGGLGKTTMAKQIMNKALKEQVFQETVIVVFSQQVDKSKIQNEIAGQLRLNLKDESSEADREHKLLKRLSSGTKRILLVLDDVWEEFKLHEFGIPCDAKGCTILITSRNRDVLLAMKVQVQVQMIFEMDELSEEDAWFLFRQRAGTCVDHSESINSKAHEVVKECGGLPIALLTVGAVLREETNVCIWRDTLQQLKRSHPRIPNVILKVYNPLKLSYDVLSPEAQFVFLLCCLFPEDADIPLEKLTYFYMGLGKFEGTGNVEEERDGMHGLTKSLKSRCLLLSGEDESHVRMHDVVRDVCIFIAKQERYIGGNDCKWISSHQLPIGSEFPNLHLLLLTENSDLSLLEGSRDLRVLSIHDDSMRSLPHTTQSLANLTTLFLYSCYQLETISVVGELVNLEILICRYCLSIEELPPKMKGLNRLKVLELTDCKKLKRIGRGIISSLIGLEELKLVESFSNWEAENAELKENAGLTELAALTNLTCLQIDISDTALAAEKILISSKMQRFQIRICVNLNGFSDMYGLLKFDKSLALELRGEICLGDWILQLLRDTEYLKLSGNGANNVDLVNSQHTRWLDLEMCDTIKNVVRTSYGDGDATVFPFIKHLKLSHLPQLQEIYDGPISSTSFHNLKELRLYHCDRLRNLGQLSIGGKDCLPQLQVIDIKDCEMMEQVFLWNEENQSRNNSESRSQQVVTKVFPKLRKVELDRLPNLETFYQGIEGIEFPLLERMTVTWCPKLKFIRSNERSGSSSSATIDDDSAHLFYKVSFGNLKSLETETNPFWGHKFRFIEYLKLLHLPQLQEICAGPISSTSFQNLKELRLFELATLKQLWKSSENNCVPILANLSFINIRRCPQLRNLGQLSIGGKDCLPQLQFLYITDCEMMEQVFLWNEENQCINNSESRNQQVVTKVFPKLRKVELDRLPNLETFYQGIEGIEFPLLERMTVTWCPKLTFIRSNERSGSSSSATIDDDYAHLFYKISFSNLENLEVYMINGCKSLFSSSVAINLFKLRELKIDSCDEMVKVVSGGERAILFPKLEELYLHDLPKLVTFCEWEFDVELHSLRRVSIEGCPVLENFSLGIEIEGCSAPNLEAFTTDFQNNFEIGVHESVENSESEKPSFFCYKFFLSIFKGLKKLEVHHFGGSSSLFTSSVSKNLDSLRSLDIRECSEIVKVIEDEAEDEKVASRGEMTILFPKLEKLMLWNLPKLVSFCEWTCDVKFPSLRDCFIRDCSDMKSFTLGFITAPNLESILIDYRETVGTKDLNGTLQQALALKQEEQDEDNEEEHEEGHEGYRSKIDNSSSI